MANDRWMAHATIYPKDITIDDFLSGLKPERDGETFVVSALRSSTGHDIRHVYRSGDRGDGYVSSYLYIDKDERETWGMFIDASGTFPKRAGRDILGAAGLEFRDFGDKVSVYNTMGSNIATGVNPEFFEALGLWASDAVGFLFLVSAVGGSTVTSSEMSRIVSDFYAPVVPLMEIDSVDTKERVESVVGFAVPNNSVTILCRTPTSGITKIGSFSRSDKASGRRMAKAVTLASEEITKSMLDEVAHYGSSVLGSGITPQTSDPGGGAQPDSEIELRKRIEALTRENSDLLKEKKDLSKKVFALQRLLDRAHADQSDDIVETVGTLDLSSRAPEPESPASRILSGEQRERVFSSFSEMESVARSLLPHILISERGMDDISAIESDNRSRTWRSVTWGALLALNEYGEALSEGRFSGNFYEFLKDQPHPTFSPRRVAMRESDTVRTNPKMMAVRTFDTPVGKVVMESHLKIDASGKHPSPRLHFAEKDGKVYVGYVGRHLRNFKTN